MFRCSLRLLLILFVVGFFFFFFVVVVVVVVVGVFNRLLFKSLGQRAAV
jgi:hypothetical protein